MEASAPNQVWTWDITKLATLSRGVFLNLYVVLDLYSRFVVAWLAARENSALAKQLLAEAIHRHGIEPRSLRVHQDRGAPMTARGFLDLLAELKVEPSHSRPRVSNDNPFSESQFKTLKYQPDFPSRFRGLEQGRAWCTEFFDWYNHHHQHSGLALFTPADVFHGRVKELLAVRQAALDAAHQAHPERFVRGRPVAAQPPKLVAINPIVPEQDLPTASTLLLEQANTLGHCRTPDLALNSMRLDGVVDQAQVGARVFHRLGIQIFAKSDESLLRSIIGQAVETHPQFMALVIRDNIAG